jgi:hypothetical protein
MTEHFYRSSGTLLSVSVLLFISAISIVGCLAALTSTLSSSSSLVAAALGLAFAILLLAWTVFVVLRMGVMARESGLEVRGWFRRRDVSWSDVEGFRFGNEVNDLTIREIFSTPMLTTYVVLKDGSHVPMPGLSATRINRKRSRERVGDLLRQLETERREHSSTTGP